MKRRSNRPKKRFGQNFLYDPAIAKRIIDAAHLAPGQVVIELGAGKGILTKPLALSGVRLIALEVDRDLHAELATAVASDCGAGREETNVEVLNIDFTKTSITGLLADRGMNSCVLIGNIPYHLTRHVLFSFLVDECEMLESAYLMVQREVGERIVAAPGNRTYGIPSVILQSLYAVRPILKVSPGSFFPPPKVDSMVVEFERLETPLVDPAELRKFCSLVRNVFQQRRKTIHNTMKSFYALSPAAFDELRAATGIDLDKRPEELSKEDFVILSRALAEVTSSRNAE